jgi:hypothetical protein
MTLAAKDVGGSVRRDFVIDTFTTTQDESLALAAHFYRGGRLRLKPDLTSELFL